MVASMMLCCGLSLELTAEIPVLHMTLESGGGVWPNTADTISVTKSSENELAVLDRRDTLDPRLPRTFSSGLHVLEEVCTDGGLEKPVEDVVVNKL